MGPGKEGIGAVVGRCSGMRKAFCTIGLKEATGREEAGWGRVCEMLEIEGLARCKDALVFRYCLVA